MKKVVMLLMSVLLLVVLAACGAKENDTAGKEAVPKEEKKKEEGNKEEASSIEVTDTSGEKITFEAAPESIAVLNSGDLDILLALGANVTGRPTANGPVVKEVEGITEIGNPHQPNFEKIAEVHPTILAASMSFKQHAENVERQGTKVVYTKANSIADIQETIQLFGQLFQ